jgi:Enoyl-(Acyl carrier protein) reductase
MHEAPERAWTLEELAQEAGLSRATFARIFSANDDDLTGRVPAPHKAEISLGNVGRLTHLANRRRATRLEKRLALSAKRGMRGMCRSLAGELSPRGIRVNAVVPVVIETPIWGERPHRPKPLLSRRATYDGLQLRQRLSV